VDKTLSLKHSFSQRLEDTIGASCEIAKRDLRQRGGPLKRGRRHKGVLGPWSRSRKHLERPRTLQDREKNPGGKKSIGVGWSMDSSSGEFTKKAPLTSWSEGPWARAE